MKNNLVSVIIPTYGRQEKLDNCINSVLNQNYDEIEIIIVDDNNPDTEERLETEKMMKTFKDKHNIKYIKHKKNINGSAARNTGFKHSKGKYICFLDDDDSFFQSKVSKQVEYLERATEFDAVYCGYVSNNNETLPKFKGSLTRELLLLDYHPMTSSIMFRREIVLKLDGFDETFKRHQDYEFMLRFFRNYKIGYVNEVQVTRGSNEGENILLGKQLESLKEYFFKQFNSELIKLELNEKGISKKIKSRHYSSVFWSHVNHNHYKMAVVLFLKQITRYPLVFLKELCISLFRYVYLKSENKLGDN